jgi:hypothetical protein
MGTRFASAAEFTLGRSPNEAFWVEDADELIVEFRKHEERRKGLQHDPGTTLWLGPTRGGRRIAWGRAGRAAEAEAVLEALRNSTTRV